MRSDTTGTERVDPTAPDYRGRRRADRASDEGGSAAPWTAGVVVLPGVAFASQDHREVSAWEDSAWEGSDWEGTTWAGGRHEPVGHAERPDVAGLPENLTRSARRAEERSTKGRAVERSRRVRSDEARAQTGAPEVRRRAPSGRHSRPSPPTTRGLKVVGAAVAVGVIGASVVAVHGLPDRSPAGETIAQGSLGSLAAVAAPGSLAPGSLAPGSLARGVPVSGSIEDRSEDAPSDEVLSVDPAPLMPTSLRMVAVSRAKERSEMPGCDVKNVAVDYPNGQIPAKDLCTIPWAPRHHLRADAAIALAKLDVAYDQRFGKDLCITDSYRSLASQISVAARKPGLAARPGHSEHGWGLAVDLCGGGDHAGTPQHDWLMDNALRFGWQNPDWAQPSASRPEAWHWEYVAGEKATS